MTNIKLQITTNAMKIRQFCVDHQYYTCGTVAEYENLLNYVDLNKQLQEHSLEWIARDIIEHSTMSRDIDYWKKEEELVTYMRNDILNEACCIYSPSEATGNWMEDHSM